MIKYQITNDYIEIFDSNEFNVKHILECGQVFRYKVTDFGYTVYSGDQKADIYCQKDSTKIFCKNKKYFVNYFDLDTNYDTIKSAISGDQFVENAIMHGSGIRILRQNPVEMIISFIISANNNIPRIKASIEKICERFGEWDEDHYTFPSIDKLCMADVEFFKSAGCGYRAEYLVDTIKSLKDGFDVNAIYKLPTEEAKKRLLTLKGVGPKVADCVLLFGFYKTDVFPTDTWIIHVYESMFGLHGESVTKINRYFHNRFGKYSGYAQQYLFYSQREK